MQIARSIASKPWVMDAGVLAMVLAVTLFSARDLFLSPVRAGQDAVIFFWPMYSFLGEELRDGNIPGWNPYHFAGTPFLADPESGWWYFPAMLVFTLLHMALAIKVYMTLHLVLAALGTYLFARMIHLSSLAAAGVALAFTLNGQFMDRARYSFAFVQVAIWVPWALIGVELALRAPTAPRRLAGWTLTGLCISLMLGGWLGQGSYYCLMTVGAYIAFRTLLATDEAERPWRTRLVRMLVQGVVPLAIGLGLAAPGLLPRFSFQQRSNVADGYTGNMSWAADLNPWAVRQMIELLTPFPSAWYLGGAVVGLGILGPLCNPRRPMVLFWIAVFLIALLLSAGDSTPLYYLFTVFPLFGDFHLHFPYRVMLGALFAFPLLAGYGIDALRQRLPRRTLVAQGAATAALIAILVLSYVDWEHGTVIALVVTATIVLIASHLPRTRMAHALVGFVICAVIAGELIWAGSHVFEQGSFTRIDPDTIEDPNATARLIANASIGEVSPRFFGYEPGLFAIHHEQAYLYKETWADPVTAGLLVNNQGTLWRVHDLQGYNPLQLERYVRYLELLNDGRQEYHGGYVLSTGLDSPLLAMLAPEFLIIPIATPNHRPDLERLAQTYPEVARTDRVRILEYTPAFPRAWLVHNTVSPTAGETVASLLTSGTIDFRTTAVLQNPGPGLEPASDPAAERVKFTSFEPDRVQIDVTAQADAMLILSEVWDEGWSATVDGEPAEVFLANGLLRGIPVPAGTHTVTLTYQAPGLVIGLLIAAATLVAILGGFLASAWLDRKNTVSASMFTTKLH